MGRGRWGGPGPWPLVAPADPHARRLRPAGSRRKHLQRRVVGEDRRASAHMAADGVGQRLHQRRCAADRPGSSDPDRCRRGRRSGSVKRKMVRVLGNRHMGQQARPRPPPLNRSGRQRSLGDPLTARTRHARAHDAVHDEAAGEVLQLLGDVIAQPPQRTAAGAAGLAGRHHGLGSWKMVRQRLALRLLFGRFRGCAGVVAAAAISLSSSCSWSRSSASDVAPKRWRRIPASWCLSFRISRSRLFSSASAAARRPSRSARAARSVSISVAAGDMVAV